jgi:amino acid transporter
MLVMLLSLGSSSAFNAFLSVGIIGVDLSYGLPIVISLFDRRRVISLAPFNMRWIGLVANVITTIWVAFSCVLFCMVRPPEAKGAHDPS